MSTNFSSPVWVVDPSDVGNTKPESPYAIVTNSGMTFVSSNEGNSISAGQISIHLTTAQILGMRNTPVTVLPAPGAGKVIIVTSWIYENVFNTTAFQAGGPVGLYYGANTVAASATLSAANTALQAARSIISAAGKDTTAIINGGSNPTLAAITNQPLLVGNATAAFTTGDGSANITVFYYILTL